MARRLARWTLRGVKGALAVVALAALVAWPWGYGHPLMMRTARWTDAAGRVEEFRLSAEVWDGRVGLSVYGRTFTGTQTARGRRSTPSAGGATLATCPECGTPAG